MPAARYLRLPLLVGLAAVAGIGWQPPAAVAQADHLLISEIVVQTRPPVETFGTKFIEIVNPTAATVDLSDVYLTDATTMPTTIYAKIVTGVDMGGGSGGDFHARFPDGASIAAGDTVVVAVLGSTAYQQAYGRLPDFELYEDGLVPDAVPEMVPAFPGAINYGLGSAGTNVIDLSTTAESVVMYRWDGQSDLVQDLDYAFWGTVTNVRPDKTGLQLDGPDADTATSSYLPDTPASGQQPIANAAHPYGGAFRRTGSVESGETATGGNGITGHDEMSERLATSWVTATAQDPPAAPAELLPTAPIFVSAVLSPLTPLAGQPATMTINVVAHDPITSAQVFYRVGGGAFQSVTATLSGSSYVATLPAFADGNVVDWYLQASTAEATALRPVDAPKYLEHFTVSAAGKPHVLLSEVSVGPGTEYVELMNPTDQDVDLSNYYLTDAVYTGQYYWQIVRPNPTQATVGGGAYSDFHARFPDGAHIAPGDTITISVTGSSAFLNDFGFQPTYELFEDGNSADGVPDMRDAFPGSILGDGTNLPTLTNPSATNGEVLVLYTWDGQSDLVTDVDILWWGNLSSSHFSKTGVSIDGPDADTTPTAYKNDTAVANQQSITAIPTGSESYQRIGTDEGDEIQSGGNGVGGDDETSENFPQTWTVATRDPAGPKLPEGAGGSVVLKVPARTFLPTAGQELPIQFASKARTHTMVRIFDLQGRLVVTLFDSAFDGPASILAEPGQYTQVSWDGRDEDFELVPAGLYIVHISSVDPRTGKEENKTAPAVVATRLSD